MKNTNIIEMQSLFNNDFKEDIIVKALKSYKGKTVERRIKISRNLDYVIRTEKIDCGKLLEKAVRDYLRLKY